MQDMEGNLRATYDGVAAIELEWIHKCLHPFHGKVVPCICNPSARIASGLGVEWVKSHDKATRPDQFDPAAKLFRSNSVEHPHKSQQRTSLKNKLIKIASSIGTSISSGVGSKIKLV